MGIKRIILFVLMILILSFSSLAITPQNSFNFRNYYNLTSAFLVQSNYFCIGSSCIGDWQVFNETNNVNSVNNSLNILISRVNIINSTVISQGNSIIGIQNNISNINTSINNEIVNRQNSDVALQNNITIEKNQRISNDSFLQLQINNLNANGSNASIGLINQVNNSLNQEILNRISNDSYLQQQINNVSAYNDTGIKNSINTLNNSIQVINNTLNNEIIARQGNDSLNQNVSNLIAQNVSNTNLRIDNLNSTKASTGNCPLGQVVQNTTTNGVQCVTPTNYTYTNGTGIILNNNQFNISNSYIQQFNYSTQITSLNNTINNVNTSNNIKGLGFNLTTELKTYFDGLYYAITNPSQYINKTVDNLTNYYNKTFSDSRFVNINGDVMTGTLGIDNINFSQTPTISCSNASVGQLFYDIDDNALSYKWNGVCLQIGEEEVIPVRNNLGFTINNCQAVYISGALGSQTLVNLTNSLFEPSSEVIGLATQDIIDNTQGKITIQGLVHDCDTSLWNEGDMLYISSQYGNLTNIKPLPPQHGNMIGFVQKKHATQGIILVTPNLGHELCESHDTSCINNTFNDILQWNGTVWINKQPYWLNITDQRYNDTNYINNVNNNVTNLYNSNITTNNRIDLLNNTVNNLIISNSTTNQRINDLNNSLNNTNNTLNNQILRIDNLNNTKIDTIYSTNNYITINNTQTNKSITFQEQVLNQTISNFITTINYNVTNISVQRGTGVIGNNTGNLSFIDNQNMIIQEDSGAIGILAYFNFTIGNAQPNNIQTYIQYNASGSTHIITIDIWKYTDNTWENYLTLGTTDNKILYNIPIGDLTTHNQSGILQLRINHASNGNTAHNLIIDELVLQKGITTIGTGQGNDPRYLHIDGSNSMTNNITFFDSNGINASYVLNSPWLNSNDQRYNDTSYINNQLLNYLTITSFNNNLTNIYNNDTNLLNKIININSSLLNEINNRVNNDSYLQEEINNLTLNISLLNTTIQNNYIDLNNKIINVNTSLNNEITARQSIGNWSADKVNYNTTSELNTLYYSINNPNNYLNSITGQIFNDTVLANTKALPGICTGTNTVQTTTTSGVTCYDTSIWNDTTLINNVNTSINIKGLGFNLTSELNNLYSPINWNPFNQVLNTTSNIVFNSLNVTNDLKIDNGSIYFNSTNNLLKTSNQSINGSVNMISSKWYQGQWNVNGNFSGMCFNGTNIIIGTSFNATAQGCIQ